MKSVQTKLTICSRGHEFMKSSDRRVCPKCWPGYYRKKPARGKKVAPTTQPHVVYHKDGSIWAKGKLAGGKPEGYWVWFRKDGTKMRSGYFINGKQGGKWTTYDKGGKVYKVTTFDH